MIEVLVASGPSSVQDLGRPLAARWGVSRSGAMDPLALRLGNLLLANPQEAAGLEIAAFPFALRFEAPCDFAVTGLAAHPRLAGRPLPAALAASAAAGETLTLEPGPRGAFAYVAFAGGLDAPLVLGSRATDLKSGFGGLGGRPLAAGQRLGLIDAGRLAGAAALLGAAWDALGDRPAEPPVLRLLPAAEWDDFAGGAREAFLEADWQVSRQVNRQGYWLDGPALAPAVRRELFSHGLTQGVVQVPPDGRPVVQMAEANTCGGYPKLGVVIESDRSLLAQRRPGERVRFRVVDWREAAEASRELERRIARLSRSLELMREQRDSSATAL